MVILKSVLAGITAVALYLVVVVLMAAGPALLSMFSTGSGGVGAVSVGFGFGVSTLMAALVFAGGFWWEFRRASKARPKA